MKKTAASGAKTPLFDRIFKPEVITLENGHTVTRPRSRTPLIAVCPPRICSTTSSKIFGWFSGLRMEFA